MKVNYLNDDLRTVVREGSFSRTAPDIAMALAFFTRLAFDGKTP